MEATQQASSNGSGTAATPHRYKLQLTIEGEVYDVRHRRGSWDLRKWDGTVYSVTPAVASDTGATHCTCDAFKYSKGKVKHCKHTEACCDRGLI